jgi:hypothetical protein
MNNFNMKEIFLEHFKGVKTAGSNTTSNVATGAVVGAGVGTLIAGSSNTGSSNVEKCPISDDSLYCQVSRTAGITGMVVFMLFILIFVVAFFYFLYVMFFSSKGSARKSMRRGRR